MSLIFLFGVGRGQYLSFETLFEYEIYCSVGDVYIAGTEHKWKLKFNMQPHRYKKLAADSYSDSFQPVQNLSTGIIGKCPSLKDRT